MGICYDEGLNQIALVMESFDFTLSQFLHQLDQQLSLVNVISVVQQIASATSYLHECGFVHSNISSHAVLIRKHPFCVKLSCFELTTTTEVPEIVQKNVRLQHKIDMSNFPKYAEIIKNDQQLKEKYYKLSKQQFYNRNSISKDQNNKLISEIDQKLLPYLTNFRRKYALFHYQAPELLKAGVGEFVIPTVGSDIYSLTLLLWECLNFCVPFVIFSELELVQLYEVKNYKLPLLEKERCQKFQKVLEDGLKVDELSRKLNIKRLISALTEAKMSCLADGLKNDVINNELIIENVEEAFLKKHSMNLNNPYPILEKMEKLNKLEEVFFAKQKISNNSQLDSQLRNENALTEMNLLDMAMRDISKMTCLTAESSEVEPHIMNEHSFSSGEFRRQQPGILLEESGRRNKIKQTVDDQKLIAPKKPARKKKQDKEVAMNQSKRSLTDSTMYQSFFDYNRLTTPKVDKDIIYERTSTLKKRLKGHNLEGARRSAKGLFEVEPPQSADDRFEKLNKELQQICDEFNRNDFMTEILKDINTKDKIDGVLGNSVKKSLEVGSSVNQITPKSSVEPVRLRKKTQSQVFDNMAPEMAHVRNASMLSSGGTSYR